MSDTELKPCPFDVWFNREVEVGIKYSDNLNTALGPYSDKRARYVRTNMKTAFEAGTRAPVAVKPLVWEDFEGTQMATTVLGKYAVDGVGLNFICLYRPIHAVVSDQVTSPYDVLDQDMAKAAAQAHHDELVRGMLA